MTEPEDGRACTQALRSGVAESVTPRGLPGYDVALLVFSAVLVAWSVFHLLTDARSVIRK